MTEDAKRSGIHDDVTEALEAAGYVLHHDKGRFMLWTRPMPNGDRVMLSFDGDEAQEIEGGLGGVPGLDGWLDERLWIVSRVDPTGGYVQIENERFTLTEAVAAGDRIPPVLAGAQDDFQTLDEAISSRQPTATFGV